MKCCHQIVLISSAWAGLRLPYLAVASPEFKSQRLVASLSSFNFHCTLRRLTSEAACWISSAAMGAPPVVHVGFRCLAFLVEEVNDDGDAAMFVGALEIPGAGAVFEFHGHAVNLASIRTGDSPSSCLGRTRVQEQARRRECRSTARPAAWCGADDGRGTSPSSTFEAPLSARRRSPGFSEVGAVAVLKAAMDVAFLVQFGEHREAHRDFVVTPPCPGKGIASSVIRGKQKLDFEIGLGFSGRRKFVGGDHKVRGIGVASLGTGVAAGTGHGVLGRGSKEPKGFEQGLVDATGVLRQMVDCFGSG